VNRDGTIDRENWILNWKRGFKGIVLVVSLVGAVPAFLLGVNTAEDFGWSVLICSLTGLTCAVIGYYAVYRLILGITALVRETIIKKGKKPKDEQKE